MRKDLTFILLCVSLLGGCYRSADDGFTWVEKDLAHEDVLISLGFRTSAAADQVEPAAKVMRGASQVADAMVFAAIISSDDGEIIGHEVATVYEQSETSNNAHYTTSNLPIPTGATECVVRFRIVLPQSEQPWTRDVTVPLK